MPSTINRVRELVLKNYLESTAFNGTSIQAIATNLNLSVPQICRVVQRLACTGSVTAVFGDGHPNAAIKALPDLKKRSLIQKLNSSEAVKAYVYPSKALLRKRVNRLEFEGRPFTLQLAHGEPQLKFVSFDPVVLEIYRNDPRYLYRAPIVIGSAAIRDEYYRSKKVLADDKVSVDSFGLCFDRRTGEQAVAAFLYDLARLSSKHQKWWEMQMLQGAFAIHSAYWRWACGEFPNSISALEAIPSQISLLNQYATAMGRPHLFRNEFQETPPEYGWLLRPTQREFSEFAQLLDKMLGENINVKFFRGEVAAEALEARRKGVVVAKRRWKPRILQDWLEANYTGADEPWRDAINTFRDIRELRNAPAHKTFGNAYDKRFVKRQRDVVVAAFRALRDLREIFATHPDAAKVKLPRWLEQRFPVWSR